MSKNKTPAKTNEEIFDTMLRQANPALHYIFQGIMKNRIQPEVVMEIVHKLWLLKSIDDGFGKVIIAMNGKNQRLLIRLITDKRVVESADESAEA